MKKGRGHAKMERGGGKLAVEGRFTSAASGPQNRDMKADYWSAESATVAKEGDKEASPTTTKSTKVEEAAARKDVHGSGRCHCNV